MKKLVASLAAAGLAFTPLALQANTRSADMDVALSAERLGSTIDSAEDLEGESEILIGLLLIGGAWALYEILDSKGIFD